MTVLCSLASGVLGLRVPDILALPTSLKCCPTHRCKKASSRKILSHTVTQREQGPLA